MLKRGRTMEVFLLADGVGLARRAGHLVSDQERTMPETTAQQPGGPAPDDAPPAPAPPPAREPGASPVRVDAPPAEEVEMGGEAPCQLPRFWDVEE